MKTSLENSISALKKGDHSALDLLFETYHKKIYYFSIKMGLAPSDAEEIVQEVFIKLWNSRGSIDPKGYIQAYIYTIAKNVIFDTFKAKVKRKAVEDYQQHLLEPVNQTEYKVEYNEMQDLIDQVLLTLPEKRRMVFELSRFKGLKNKDIAKEMGISIKTVETHLTLALQTFRSVLKRSESIYLLLLLTLFT